jgi:hypothetical protein
MRKEFEDLKMDVQISNFRCADDEKLKFDYRRDY